jgi:hypothetical protein
MFAMIDLVYLCAGGAIVWLYKDKFLAWWGGAEAFAVKLKAEAAAIEAKISTIKAAVKS